MFYSTALTFSAAQSQVGGDLHHRALLHHCGHIEEGRWALDHKILEQHNVTVSSTPQQSPTSSPELRQGTPEPRQVTTEQYQGKPDPRQDTPDPRQGTPEPRQVTPEPRQDTPDLRQDTPNPRQGTPESRHGTPKPRQSTPESRQGTPEPRQDTPEPRKGTPDPGQGTPESRQGTLGAVDNSGGNDRGRHIQGAEAQANTEGKERGPNLATGNLKAWTRNLEAGTWSIWSSYEAYRRGSNCSEDRGEQRIDSSEDEFYDKGEQQESACDGRHDRKEQGGDNENDSCVVEVLRNLFGALDLLSDDDPLKLSVMRTVSEDIIGLKPLPSQDEVTAEDNDVLSRYVESLDDEGVENFLALSYLNSKDLLGGIISQ